MASVPKLAELSVFWISRRLCLLSALSGGGRHMQEVVVGLQPTFPQVSSSALGSLRELSGSPTRPALLLAQAHLVPGCWKGRPRP